MKKTLFAIIATIVVSSSSAQKIASENVPAAVTSAFKAKFSIAEKATWEMDYDNYEADFVVGKSPFTAKFDKDGKWIETYTYLKSAELPKVIKEALASKYGELSGYKTQEARKVEKEKGTFYEMETIKGEKTYVLVFNEAGELLEDDIKAPNLKD